MGFAMAEAMPARARATTPGRLLQRCGGHKCPTGTCDHKDDKASVVQRVLASPGHPLDPPIRTDMESRFGHDFSTVRIHSDPSASRSAEAVGALAYTVGPNVVFRSGLYPPTSSSSTKLLAHELVHVVQQRSSKPIGVEKGTLQGKLEISQPGDHYEREADLIATRVTSLPAATGRACPSCSSGAAARGLTPSGPALMRQTPPAQQSRADRIREVMIAAGIRVQLARQRVVGLAPPPPRGGSPGPEVVEQMRARRLARLMFEWDDPNMDQIGEILATMQARLAGGSTPTVQEPASDPNCGSRAAYVVDFRPPIHLCPAFFASSREQQIRTMIHESAHLARIGQATVGEGYCAFFDCAGPCPGGFSSADSWAHFVHCLSDQVPDRPPPITGRPQSGQQPAPPRPRTP